MRPPPVPARFLLVSLATLVACAARTGDPPPGVAPPPAPKAPVATVVVAAPPPPTAAAVAVPPPPPPAPPVAPAVDSAPPPEEPPAPRHVDGFRPDGLEVTVLAPGSGRAAQAGDHLRVDYVGTLLSGKQFDSSHDKGREPFRFVLGQGSVIKGWEEGVVGMQVGEIRRLTLPPELAYGERGRSPMIPPSATLVYEVQLLAIEPR